MKNIATVALSAFLNGALAAAATHLADGVPSNSAQWSAAGVGALLAGVIAVLHLYTPTPGAS